MENPQFDSLEICCKVANYLGHVCCPDKPWRRFETTKSLLESQRKEVEEYNKDVPPIMSAGTWKYDRQGLLKWRTTSKRMRITADKEWIRFELFSPSFGEGERPFFTLTASAEGIEWSVPAVAGSVIQEKPKRLHHLESTIDEVVPYETPTIKDVKSAIKWEFGEKAALLREVDRAIYGARHL